MSEEREQEEGSPPGAGGYNRAEAMRLAWASLTPEERELRRQRQREGARRMWAARTERERKRVGKLISEGRRGGASS